MLTVDELEYDLLDYMDSYRASPYSARYKLIFDMDYFK